MNLEIRAATKSDLNQILALITELAIYEKAGQEVTITLEELEEDGFGSNPLFKVIVAEVDREIVGMSFYFISYSTWKGKCIYLEDIIVKNEWRGKGIGGALFDEMIKISHEFGAKRMTWQVLDWNEPAINFYKKYDAILDPEWINGKLTDKDLEKLVQ